VRRCLINELCWRARGLIFVKPDAALSYEYFFHMLVESFVQSRKSPASASWRGRTAARTRSRGGAGLPPRARATRSMHVELTKEDLERMLARAAYLRALAARNR